MPDLILNARTPVTAAARPVSNQATTTTTSVNNSNLPHIHHGHGRSLEQQRVSNYIIYTEGGRMGRVLSALYQRATPRAGDCGGLRRVNNPSRPAGDSELCAAQASDATSTTAAYSGYGPAWTTANNRPFLYPPTPQSIQTLLDSDSNDLDRPKTILRHALSFAVSHADVELTTWLTSVQGDMVSTPSPRGAGDVCAAGARVRAVPWCHASHKLRVRAYASTSFVGVTTAVQHHAVEPRGE